MQLPLKYAILLQIPKQPSRMQTIKIEIWSDMVCPFCLIGKKKMEQAIQNLGLQQQVEIQWHSYQLDPTFPQHTAVPATQSLIEKKGISEAQLKGMYHHLETMGSHYGVDFKFDKSLTFNTLDTHRLWHWTMQFHKENEWKEAVMQAYFTHGIDLSQKANLLALIQQIGLNPQEAESVLEASQFEEEVRQDLYQAQTIGIRGVPFFLFNDKFAISGAQEDSVFEDTLRKMLA